VWKNRNLSDRLFYVDPAILAQPCRNPAGVSTPASKLNLSEDNLTNY